MESVLKIIEIIIDKENNGINVLLLLIIAALIWDRMNLIKNIKYKDKKLEKIIEDYNKGNMGLAEALNNIRLILSEIKHRL